MTSRRAIPGYDQRVSRALQFVPGHLGGRVASAQPVRRRGGTIRREAVGAAGAAPSFVEPTIFERKVGYSPAAATPATIDTLAGFTLSTGDMVATVLMTTGTATPPAGWRLMYSHTFAAYTYYLGAYDSVPASPAGTWAMDWSGASGGGFWAWHSIRFAGGSLGGLLWQYTAANYAGTSSGTWVAPGSWLYSAPLAVCEECEYDDTYDDNTLGADSTYAADAANGAGLAGPYGSVGSMLPTPSGIRSLPATYAPGAVNGAGLVWQPDQAYVCWDSLTSPSLFSGSPYHATIRLGIA